MASIAALEMTSLRFIQFLLGALAAGTALAAPPAAVIEEKHRAFLKEYCVECHDAEKQKGKLRLDDIALTVDTVEKADRWQKILNQINSGEMPPDDAKQPDRTAKADFLEMLSETMVAARRSIGDSGGRLTLRRLNRREYQNTLRDLLGVEIPVAELPSDTGAGTFDTVGASLYMSADQFEQYLALGRQAIDEHMVRYARPVVGRHWHLEVEDEATPRLTRNYAARVDARRRYEAWTQAVDAAVGLPGNKTAADALKAEKPGDPTHAYAQWRRIPGAPDPKAFGFDDAIHAEQQGRRNWLRSAPQQKAYLEHPATRSGAFLTWEDFFANPEQHFRLPGDWPAGDYVLRIRAAATHDTPASRHFLEFGPLHGAASSTHEITGTLTNPQVIEIPLRVTAGGSRGYFLRERGSFEVGNRVHDFFAQEHQRNGIGPAFALWIDWIEVTTAGVRPPLRQRREVELHANAKVGGTYQGYYQGGHDAAQKFLATGAPQPGIPDAIEAKFRLKVFAEHAPTFKRYLDDPLTRTGAYLTIKTVNPEEVIALPPDQPSGWLKTKHVTDRLEPGEYRLRIRVGAVKDAPAERRFLQLGTRIAKDEFGLLRTFEISGTTDRPQVIEYPVTLTAQGPRSFVLREKREVKADDEAYNAARKATGLGPPPALWIDWVEWEGPIPKEAAPSKIPSVLAAGTAPNEQERARAILADFALRAFRGRPAEPAYLNRLVALHERRRQAGESFDQAVRTPLAAILASPGFLYLAEPNDGPGPRRLDDLELASRLSYFLWSAPPDERLLGLAREKRLRDPAVLVAETDRLLADPRARDFVQGFVHQWLGLDRLDFFQFDPKQFSAFDESTKEAARREVYETFGHLLRENRSLTRLLKSDEVVVNGLLAGYYGLGGVSGDEFRPVRLPSGSPRGGLLGMAAILAMGGNGERTSPVERGAWILRKLLHDPPPPAPPNVPQLNRLETKPLTTRERLAAHQAEPQCAQCHRKIDPIGFGLENFDAAGRWRTTETFARRGQPKQTWPIDPAGAFHKGPAFRDYHELRDLIAARPEQFARGYAEALIEYGLGRPYGFFDMELADDLVRQAAREEFAVRAFIRALVLSTPFQTK